MTYQDLLKKITSHYSSDLPFVVFSYPNSDELKLYTQETVELFSTENFAAPGFVMAPFTESKKVPFIPEDKSELFQATLDNVKVSEEEPEIDFKSQREKNTSILLKKVCPKSRKKRWTRWSSQGKRRSS